MSDERYSEMANPLLAWNGQFVEDIVKQMPPEARDKWEKAVFAAEKHTEEVPLLWIAKALTWKDGCKHTETMVHYREDVAGGDFIVWKEICNRCSTIVKSGMGVYKESPVEGRTVTISPTTNYNDGWVWNLK